MQRTTVWRAAGLTGLLAVVVVGGVTPAVAEAGLTAAAPSTVAIAQDVPTRLAGMSVSGAAADDTLAVTVETTQGTVHVDTTTDIALAYGSAATGASVSFTGTPAEVNAALAATDLTTPAGSIGQTATVTLTAYRREPGIVYGAATGHFYEFVAASHATWDAAQSAVAGRSFLGKTGYLVTITSSDENSIVTSRIPDAQNVWIGAQAWQPGGSFAREWRWVAGPESGTVISRCTALFGTCDFLSGGSYANWATGEPNNSDDTRGGEWVAVTNWGSHNGQWNDLAATHTEDVSGYVVEYGDGTAFTGVATASAAISILGVPGAPTSVSASAGALQATVSFTAPATDGGSSALTYTATTSPGGATATCTTSPCTVTGLTAWTAYTFTVTATNALGTSPASSATTAVTPVPPPSVPGAPTGMTTTPLVGVPYTSAVGSTGYPFPTYAVTGGALPAGLALAADGAVTGTPTATGPWSVEVTATNTQGTATATLTGYVGRPPTAVTGTLPSLVWGTPVAVVLGSAGYPAPVFGVTAGGLPPGLSLDPATGAITGVPTSAQSFTATVTASNAHGSQSMTLSGTVAPIRPSAPSALVATRGDGLATVTFDAPDSDGGSAVTGYGVRIDDGTWQPLTTTVDGTTLRGTVTGLVNGVEVELRVRAVNGAGAGPASGHAPVTPVAPPPTPVAAPTVVAGASSVTVTWPASTERDVTGYTVTAWPGPATCTAGAGETSCTLGAVADRAVRFTVVTHSRWGDSPPSQASELVVPTGPRVPAAPPATAPTTLTTSVGVITSVQVGETITVIGTGFAPFSTAAVVIYSTPRVLGTVTTDATGGFRLTVTVPANLEVGAHTFVAYGADPSGTPYAMRLPVDIPAAPASLARTGADAQSLMALVAAMLVAGGALRVTAARRSRAHVACRA